MEFMFIRKKVRLLLSVYNHDFTIAGLEDILISFGQSYRALLQWTGRRVLESILLQTATAEHVHDDVHHELPKGTVVEASKASERERKLVPAAPGYLELALSIPGLETGGV